MIERLRGQLVHKDAVGVVLDCGGVGYGVAMSATGLSRVGAVGEGACLLVHTHVAEDALRLFGFVDAAERAAFLVLLSTSGVGPRLALAILSTLGPGELALAVEGGDRAALTQVPGVGGKKADRLLVELRGRLGVGAGAEALAPVRGDLRADLLSALVNLGFDPKLAERAARQALAGVPAAAQGAEALPHLLRQALRATQ